LKLSPLFFILLVFISSPVFSAVDESEMDPQIVKLASELESARKSIVEDEVRSREVMSSLFEINRRMKKLVADKSNLEQERLLLESQTKELANRLLELEDRVSAQKVLMRERLSAIYKLGGQGLARILFASISSAQLERNLKILGIVAKRDLDLIKQYAVNVKELEVRRKRFSQRLAHLKKLESVISKKEKNLLTENNSKSMILASIKKSKTFNLKKFSQLRSRSEDLANNEERGFYDLLLRPSFFEQKGSLPYPIKGYITQAFGLIKDSKQNAIIPHKGLLIRAQAPTNVNSVFSGKVVWKGNISDFGNTIVVDHGDHYYSVYSHIQYPLVSVGDEVAQSQPIASISSLNQGLYFEIRHFSEPTNPLHWLKTN
jgi:murein hydrolase activator